MTHPQPGGSGPGRKVTRRTRAAALALSGTALAGLTWFVGARPALTGPHLTSPATAAFGISLPSTKAGQAYTFGSLPVCLDKPGTVAIDGITPVGAKGGLAVTAFAARLLSHELYGAEPVRLSSSGFGGSTTVDTTCDSSVGGAEVAVELVKSEATNARMDGITIAWHSSATSGEVTMPFHLVLCQSADQDVPECQSMP